MNSMKNSEGYLDLTAYHALKHMEQEEYRRFRKLLRTIFNVCSMAGFRIDGRIVLIDKKTGRIWR